jgi:hypothetical protein
MAQVPKKQVRMAQRRSLETQKIQEEPTTKEPRYLVRTKLKAMKLVQ